MKDRTFTIICATVAGLITLIVNDQMSQATLEHSSIFKINQPYIDFLHNCDGYTIDLNVSKIHHTMCISQDEIYKLAKQLGAKEFVQP